MSKENAFIWHPEWDESFDIIAKNAPELALKVFYAIRKYGIKGEDTEVDWRVLGLFDHAKRDIDHDNARHNFFVEAGAKAIYDKEIIEDLLKKGMSTKEIALRFGCSARRIRQIRSEMAKQKEITIGADK